MACSVSSTVEPVATQPGKSGTYAEKLAPASSITIADFEDTHHIATIFVGVLDLAKYPDQARF
jgi:hypothetical protein